MLDKSLRRFHNLQVAVKLKAKMWSIHIAPTLLAHENYVKDVKCVKYKEESPKSECIAGDLCIYVVKTITTHSSPRVIVEDLKTSGIVWSVVTSKSEV